MYMSITIRAGKCMSSPGVSLYKWGFNVLRSSHSTFIISKFKFVYTFILQVFTSYSIYIIIIYMYKLM